MMRRFLSSRRLGDPHGCFQPRGSQESAVVVKPLGQDRAEGGPGHHSPAFPSAATTVPSRGCCEVWGMGGKKTALPLHVRVITSSVMLGKATRETAFSSHRKKGKTAKILSVLSQEEMLKSWKSVCLEKDSNTLKLRSGQLEYFEPLYVLFYVC